MKLSLVMLAATGRFGGKSSQIFRSVQRQQGVRNSGFNLYSTFLVPRGSQLVIAVYSMDFSFISRIFSEISIIITFVRFYRIFHNLFTFIF